QVQALVRIDLRFVDHVPVSGKDQIPGDVQRFQRRPTATPRSHAPVLGVFKIGGSRGGGSRRSTARSAPTRAAHTASPTPPGRRGCRNRHLALLRQNRFANQFHWHEVRSQWTGGLRRAASGLQPPLRQVAGDVECRGIEAARRQIPPLKLVGGQKVEIYLHLF